MNMDKYDMVGDFFNQPSSGARKAGTTAINPAANAGGNPFQSSGMSSGNPMSAGYGNNPYGGAV